MKILQWLSVSIDLKSYAHGSPYVLSACCLVPAVLQMSAKVIHTFHLKSHWKLGSNSGLQYAHSVPLVTLRHSQTGIMLSPKFYTCTFGMDNIGYSDWCIRCDYTQKTKHNRSIYSNILVSANCITNEMTDIMKIALLFICVFLNADFQISNTNSLKYIPSGIITIQVICPIARSKEPDLDVLCAFKAHIMCCIGHLCDLWDMY